MLKTHCGKNILVDSEDLKELSKYKWYLSWDGYALCHWVNDCGKRTKRSIHRIIMNATKGIEVDHINGNRLDNRRCNLRLCNSSQNKQNIRKSKGTSRYKGVRVYKNKWRAEIQFNKKKYSLGYYSSEVDAAKAYNTKALELFGVFAVLNDV